jgi:ankyrin repeat protein
VSQIPSFNTTLAEPLIEACSEGRFKDVVSLLESGADPNSTVEEMGRYGARKVYPMTATFRVLARGDALPKLAQKQSERIIHALVQAGAQMRQVDREVLLHAVRMGMPDMIVYLVGRGARVHRYGHELMEMAILNHRSECIVALKSLGIDPNVRDQWGSTTFLDLCSGALKFAPIEQNLHLEDPVAWFRKRFSALFQLGVQINSTDGVGATALMRSIVAQQDPIMHALLDEGASLQPTMRNGVNALHLAAASGSLSRVKRILRNIADRSQIERMRALSLQPDIKAHLAQLLSQHWTRSGTAD